MSWAQCLSHQHTAPKLPPLTWLRATFPSCFSCLTLQLMFCGCCQPSVDTAFPTQILPAIPIFDFPGKLPTSYCVFRPFLITTEYLQGNRSWYFCSVCAKITEAWIVQWKGKSRCSDGRREFQIPITLFGWEKIIMGVTSVFPLFHVIIFYLLLWTTEMLKAKSE